MSKKREEKSQKLNLRGKILNQINSKKPKSRSYFLIRNIFLVLILIFFIFFTSFLLTIFWFDFFELWEIYNFLGFLNIKLFSRILLEIFLISLLIIFFLVVLYRKTDWFLVKHQWLLFGIFLFVTFSLSLFSVVIARQSGREEQILRPSVTFFEQLPYRRKRSVKIQKNLTERNLFLGRIKEVDFEKGFIVVENVFKQRIQLNREEIFYIPPDSKNKMQSNKESEILEIDKKVLIEYRVENEKKFIKEIKTISPRRFFKR